MNIVSNITISSTDLDTLGTAQIPAHFCFDRISVDFRGFNTAYNIPDNTSFIIESTTLTIPLGYYSINQMVNLLDTLFKSVNPDANVYKDTNLQKVVYSGPSLTVNFTQSSPYLLSLIGFNAAIYSGTSIQAPNVAVLYPGGGIWLYVSGFIYNTKPNCASYSVPVANCLIPWADFGGSLMNYDHSMPRVFCIRDDYDINSISVTILDAYKRPVNFNGAPWNLIISAMK